MSCLFVAPPCVCLNLSHACFVLPHLCSVHLITPACYTDGAVYTVAILNLITLPFHLLFALFLLCYCFHVGDAIALEEFMQGHLRAKNVKCLPYCLQPQCLLQASVPRCNATMSSFVCEGTRRPV